MVAPILGAIPPARPVGGRDKREVRRAIRRVTFRRGASGLTIERNNNPGALRRPGSLEFQRFPSVAAGIAAQEALLGRYFNRGRDTISSVIETYAPRRSRGGDNTDAQVNNYIGYVARRLGINPSQRLSANDVSRLARAMREFETGRRGP